MTLVTLADAPLVIWIVFWVSLALFYWFGEEG